MKIAFIGQKGIPAKSGGVENHVENLAVELAQKGHAVFVYVRNNYTDKNLMEYKGVKLIHLPSIPTKNLDAISHTFFAIVHAIFQKYDVVHFHSIGPNSLNFLIKIFKPKTALIATYHCQDYLHQKWGAFARTYLKLGEYMTCKITDKTIVVTKTLQKFVRDKFKKETVVIPSGVRVAKNANTNELEKWGLKENEYIISVSRLIRHKGIHYLIEAFKNLEDRNLTGGKKLVIVGDGFYTSDYVAELKKIAEVSKNIIFVGAQNGEALSQLFSHSYLFVQPSNFEGLSIALLEAMAYGKAVLVSDIAENVEAVAEAGVLFKQGDVVDLENKLAELIGNQERVNALAQAGKERAEKLYNWNELAYKIENVYKEAINRKNKNNRN
ncbi:MAG: glycosyl transferase family 1 [Candidatus Moranbacteria bacterium CG23_combo_of_CG06-09_8_20_14_all_39_10]|nr:MAG: glycosyl transferase family 1 [Candidatus Moranbacteria bacterium CG23_combo_of_CG06-09_8_20_14_all_39_10]